jgi:hypothetical protein
MKKQILSYSLIFFLVLGLNSFSQQENKHEVNTSVPELSDFHEIIYPIWHTYYPAKDFAGLRSMLNDVNTGAEKIYSAQLPGFYQDKLAKWKNGVEVFKKTVDDFNAAVKGTDDELLLKSAEELHSKYEMLVRLLHPVPKQVEYFHLLLYVIYHDYLPNEKWSELKSVVLDLKTRADSIMNSRISKRIEPKKEQFYTAAKELIASCVSLIEVCNGNDPKAIRNATELMHSKYQAVEKIFD